MDGQKTLLGVGFVVKGAAASELSGLKKPVVAGVVVEVGGAAEAREGVKRSTISSLLQVKMTAK